MIAKGPWPWELKKLALGIIFWKRMGVFGWYAEYRLTRSVLYGATILRKMFEDEKEASKLSEKQSWPTPDLPTDYTKLPVIRFPYVADGDWTVREKIGTSNYSGGTHTEIQVRDICNQILHSYVWSIVGTGGLKGYDGFILASDNTKNKCAYYVSFEDWRKLLRRIATLQVEKYAPPKR